VALTRVRKAALEERVELRRGDAVSTSFPDGNFDAVFLCFALELFDTPEIPLVLKECRRVLRQGGRLCVVAMSKIGKANLMTRLYDWGHRNIQAYVDCRPIYARQSLEEAGFKIMEAQVMLMWGLPVEIVLAGKQ
jgi:ubiquinone/menaquinone biosynthesis C-methylase UbiE